MKLFVRCPDRMVFEVDRETLEPKSVSCYDAYCYSDPRTDVEYMEQGIWAVRLNEIEDKKRQRRLS
jgi:hypothetical protein